MKRDVMMLAGAMLTGLVGGAVSHQLFTTTTGVSGYAQQERVIRAERFELVDRDGKTRAVLGEGTRGFSKEEKPFPGLFWVDEEGKTRAVFGVLAASPLLALYDSKGGSSSLSVLGDLGPFFSLSDSKGDSSSLSVGVLGPYFTLSDSKGGSSSLNVGDLGPYFTLRDAKGGMSWLEVGAGGPHFTLSDAKGGLSSLRVNADGPSFHLFAGPILKTKSSAILEVGTDGPSLSFADKDDKTRAVLGSTQLKNSRTGSVEIRPPSSLVLFGENGKSIWQVP